MSLTRGVGRNKFQCRMTIWNALKRQGVRKTGAQALLATLVSFCVSGMADESPVPAAAATNPTDLIQSFLPVMTPGTNMARTNAILRIPLPEQPFDGKTPEREGGLLEAQEAIRAYESGHYERALTLFREEATRNPTNGLFYWIYGNTCARLMKQDEAIWAYDRWIQLSPTNGVAYANRARSFLEEGNFDRAVDDVNEALRRGPRGPRLYELLAAIHEKKGDVDKTIADLTAQMEKRRNNPELYKSRGALFFAGGKLDNAEADFDEASNLEPEDAVAEILGGELNNQRHAWTNAILKFTRAIELSTDDQGANYAGRGRAEMKSGQPVAAIEDYTRAIEKNPKERSYFSERGYLYLKQKDYGRAESDLRFVLTLEPRNVPAMVDLSDCLVHEHRYREAVEMVVNDNYPSLQ